MDNFSFNFRVCSIDPIPEQEFILNDDKKFLIGGSWS